MQLRNKVLRKAHKRKLERWKAAHKQEPTPAPPAPSAPRATAASGSRSGGARSRAGSAAGNKDSAGERPQTAPRTTGGQTAKE